MNAESKIGFRKLLYLFKKLINNLIGTAYFSFHHP